MPVWLTEAEYGVLEAACDRLIPRSDRGPGATAAGVADYVDGLLGAFSFDPPRIWAGGPTSGRMGGEAGFARFHRLSAIDELAWRTRIEGSQGLPEREFNGPVVGLQERYRQGLDALGADFCDLDATGQEARLRADTEFVGPALRARLRGHVRSPRVRRQPRTGSAGGPSGSRATSSPAVGPTRRSPEP